MSGEILLCRIPSSGDIWFINLRKSLENLTSLIFSKSVIGYNFIHYAADCMSSF